MAGASAGTSPAGGAAAGVFEAGGGHGFDGELVAVECGIQIAAEREAGRGAGSFVADLLKQRGEFGPALDPTAKARHVGRQLGEMHPCSGFGEGEELVQRGEE